MLERIQLKTLLRTQADQHVLGFQACALILWQPSEGVRGFALPMPLL